MQLNCCSLISKIDVIRLTLIADAGIHILCITETWFKPYHSSDLFKIPNYTLVRLDRTRLSTSGSFIHGGGVACYVREDIIFHETELNFSSLDLEILTLNVLPKEHREYFLSIVYRPPSGNYHVALNKISDIIGSIRNCKKRYSIIIGGDFNIDVSKTRQTPMLKY